MRVARSRSDTRHGARHMVPSNGRAASMRRLTDLLEHLRMLVERTQLTSATLFRRAHSRSLQSHILALFLVLMVGVQVGGFVLINTVGMTAARKSIGEDLVAGALVFNRLLDEDTHRLVQGAHLMSSDYTFREVIASRSEEHTSELQSHLNLVCRLLLEKKKYHSFRHPRHIHNLNPTPVDVLLVLH